MRCRRAGTTTSSAGERCVGVEREDKASRPTTSADQLHGDERRDGSGGDARRRCSENIRPTVTAGLANDVELVNQ